ncbi:MAG: 16S rRNA (uracil(1498)-N(3))-methyltransferase [Bacteroidales bacterium]|nr:16S rRNA (uracil(1498)-N(3))-methyltransferase [Bacteroidales bacterium]
MYLFYAPDIEINTTLPEEESVHCARVLRLNAGEKIRITDGKGFFYDAQIISSHPKHCEVLVENKEEWKKSWNFNLHLAIAPTKNMDRMEWLVEKLTELGIDSITPLLCRYSERKELKAARLEKILVSAMKQSQKALLPQLNPMIPFSAFLKQPLPAGRYIAHCHTGEKELLKNSYRAAENAVMLIGPEGDFSEQEVEMACQVGFKPVTLGETRLRTETAALFACSTLHVINQE